MKMVWLHTGLNVDWRKIFVHVCLELFCGKKRNPTASQSNNRANIRWSSRDSSDIREATSIIRAMSTADQAIVHCGSIYGLFLLIKLIIDEGFIDERLRMNPACKYILLRSHSLVASSPHVNNLMEAREFFYGVFSNNDEYTTWWIMIAQCINHFYNLHNWDSL